MDYETWKNERDKQLQIDFIDAHEDMYDEYCKAEYEGRCNE